MAYSATSDWLTGALLVAVLSSGTATTVHASTSPPFPPEVEQWGIEELTLHSHKPHLNPFTEVQLSATVTCSGRELRVSGFFDGGNTWRVRYMPSVEGHCSFVTSSNDPELDNVRGRFSVTPPLPGNHGDVHVAKTYHFSYADGTPYFLLGTTLYNWINRDEALRNQTIESLRTSPFTKVRFALFPKWYIYNRVEPELYPFVQASPRKFDLDRFDPRFFRELEEQLKRLQGMGIEADIILFHPYDNWGFATMDAQHDDAYIRYVVARISAFRNVWWTMANEYDLFDPKLKPSLKTKDWDRMFRTLEASDPYSHPRGIHNFADWYDHSKPWISHVIIQDGTGHPARRLPDARQRYKKPLVVDEYGYEGDNGQAWGNISGAEEVSRHWDITMAGGYGSQGETYVHPGGVLWWAAGGRLVGESPERLGFLRQVMTAAPFQDLVPSPDIVQGGTALAVKGKYYLLRVKALSYNQQVEIALEEGHRYQVDLIDPWRMKVYRLGITQGGTQAFNPPITPGVFRFSEVEDSRPQATPVSVQGLIAAFLKDPTIADAPKAVPIKTNVEVFTEQFTLGELLDDARTNSLVHKFLHVSDDKRLRGLTLEQIQGIAGLSEMAGDLQGLIRELHKIPVDPDKKLE